MKKAARPKKRPRGGGVEMKRGAPAKGEHEEDGKLGDAASKGPPKSLKTLEKIWGKELWKAGWLAIPKVLLEKQAALQLSPTDLNVILQVAKHWWTVNRLPYPGKRSIAACMGKDPRTIQRVLASLEKRQLVKRELRPGEKGGKASQTSVYHLKGLIDAAKPHAVEMKKKRDAKRKMSGAKDDDAV